MDEENSSEEDNHPEDAEVPRVKLQSEHVPELLCPFFYAAEHDKTGEKSSSMGARLRQGQRKKGMEAEYRCSMEVACID